MPRWVGACSAWQWERWWASFVNRVVALYPLSFFTPAAMLVGFVGMYLDSRNPLFLAVAAVVGLGVLATGASMGAAILRQRKAQAEA
jgi:hypothetical protein